MSKQIRGCDCGRESHMGLGCGPELPRTRLPVVGRDVSEFQWHKWPDENDGEYPPDATPVLVREETASGVSYCVSGINRRCGVYGQSFATHWALIPETIQK
jgi:hypothetical protein